MTTNRDEQPARAESNRITTGSIEAFGPSGPRLVGERGQPTRVLIVEDDQTMRNLVVNYLEEHDIEAVSAFELPRGFRQFVASQPGLPVDVF